MVTTMKAKKKLWETLVNTESKDGTWDVVFTGATVHIVRWSEAEVAGAMIVPTKEWKELCQLILRVNRPAKPKKNKPISLKKHKKVNL
jgi:hypothetical protein